MWIIHFDLLPHYISFDSLKMIESRIIVDYIRVVCISVLYIGSVLGSPKVKYRFFRSRKESRQGFWQNKPIFGLVWLLTIRERETERVTFTGFHTTGLFRLRTISDFVIFALPLGIAFHGKLLLYKEGINTFPSSYATTATRSYWKWDRYALEVVPDMVPVVMVVVVVGIGAFFCSMHKSCLHIYYNKIEARVYTCIHIQVGRKRDPAKKKDWIYFVSIDLCHSKKHFLLLDS